MKSNSNIVHLNPGRGTEVQPHLPLPLIRLRDTSTERLKALLGRMFDSADDALFELADRAGSNSDQSLYFDAMREVRLKRKQIEMTFLQGVARAFAELPRERVEARVETVVDFETLDLVQNDELEERVAIDSMVSRASSQQGRELQHLTLRMDCLMRPVAVTDASNPLGPRVLCVAFRASCEELTADIRAKLVLLKLFEKFTLSGLQELYQAANALLVEQGVMPDLKAATKPVRPAGASRVQGSAGLSGAARDDGMSAVQVEEAEVFGALRELLAEQRVEGRIPTLTPMGRGAAGGFAMGAAGANQGALPVLSQGDLLYLLSQAQHRQDLTDHSQNNGGLIDYRSLLPSLLQQAGRQGRVNPVDDDVINLVAMLFEFILDDRQLPVAMKALIARLQIPMLKVAVLDKTFFSKRGHPARRLLNELATAAIGWNEKATGERDPLRERIEAVVERLTQDFEADLQVLEDVLADFQRFVETEQRRGQLVEQRIRDAEEGRAKSEGARRDVQDALNEALAGHRVPEAVLKLLRDGWSDLMVLQHLKHGVTSAEWAQALNLAHDLIWSVCPPPERNARRRLVQMIPGLLKGLREGLTTTSMSPFEMDRLLKELEVAHLDVLQRLLSAGKALDAAGETGAAASGALKSKAEVSPALAPAPQAAPTVSDASPTAPGAVTPQAPVSRAPQAMAAKPQEQSDIAAKPQERLDAGKAAVSASSVVETAALVVETLAPAVETVAGGVEPVGGVVPEAGQIAPSIQLLEVEDETPADVIDERYFQRVDSLHAGCWVEFYEEDDKKFRAKLVAVIKTTGKFIFVNRAGVKVSEKTRTGLAMALRDGKINPLDDGLLFDRALESVIGNLRGATRA